VPDALDRAAELAQSIGDADRVERAKAVAFYVADRFVASRGTENEVPVRYLLDVIEVSQFFGE
jgi:hypothetical protein